MRKFKLPMLLILSFIIWNNHEVKISTTAPTAIVSRNSMNAQEMLPREVQMCNNAKDDSNLVYRNYGNALSLNAGSTCYLYDMSVTEEPKGEAYITIVNILTGEEKVIERYVHQDYIEYTVVEDGEFYIYLISADTRYDLTDQVSVSYICENNSQGLTQCFQ